jgi:hypothetical protein
MGARPVGQFVAETLRGLRRPLAAAPESLQEVWDRVAGPGLAAAVRVLGYRGGTLTLATPSPALRGEIESYRRAELVRRLNQELPVSVSRLVVRLDG